ncbi:hypothetical protein CWI38_0293p0020 [Hamiltosporidium tvaerminnensis]|uniref:Reverse transcriptase n=1 Tax=Hamiltosporidium tvaerminnensis TaxID=1176355 RepID=A0A4Q9LYK3_9MICR|nr:hypothetical protein CWI38_0293p0020 [Hamiltosporidium tvaerminnensis]
MLRYITSEAKMIFKDVWIGNIQSKVGQKDLDCEDTANIPEGAYVYKYLGKMKDSRGILTRSSFEEVQSKLVSRVERLCQTRLNAKNLFSAINQHAIWLISYHIGVLRLEPADFSKLDEAVRAVLVKNKIHLLPGCKERLYLPRTELGRGLHSVELRSEHMLLQLLDSAILKVVNNNKTHLALIKGFLKVKYRLVEEVTKKSLEEAQLAKLYNEIKKRKLLLKLYNARKNELVCHEMKLCSAISRMEMYSREANGLCQHCGKSVKTVDHLATRCEKMLGNEYTIDTMKCSHSVFEILDNEYAEIRGDNRIKTDVKIRNNRPDISILDKKKNKITLIKVQITSQDSLQIVETEKLRKIDLLASELGFFYKSSVEIILYMMVWSDIVTKYYKLYHKNCEYL